MVEKGFKCRGFNKECNKEVEYGKISICVFIQLKTNFTRML